MDRDEYEDYNLEDDDDDDYEPEQDEEDDEMEFELEEALERAADDAEEDNDPPEATLADLLSTALSALHLAPSSMNTLGLPSPTGSDHTARRLSLLTRLLNHRRSIVDDDDDDDDDGLQGLRRAAAGFQQRGHHQYSAPKEPQPAGVQLSQSGAFGNPLANATLHKQPLQKSLKDAKRSLSLPLKNELFNVCS